MKRLVLLATLVALSPLQGQAAIDPKVAEFCMNAADFSGCVKTMSGADSKESNLTEAEQKLLQEIKKLPNRLTRTSLADFQANVRGFTDALSIAKYDSPNSELVQNSEKLLLSFDILYQQWRRKIRGWNQPAYPNNVAVKTSFDALFGGNTLP